MSIPAPERFTDLRKHLHTAGIDAAFLCLTLEQYLNLPDNMPTHDWMLDPHEDHQAWEYRQNLNGFREMIVDKPDTGNGDEDNEDDVAS